MRDRFHDRREAGRALAEQLDGYRGRRGAVVLGIARGGVPVAFEVAEALNIPLDVLIVRKLGVPGHDELAFGAVTAGRPAVLDDSIVRQLQLTPEQIERVAERETAELRRRELVYRGDRAPADLTGATVIVVDDGVATGSTMRAAVRSVRAAGAEEIVVAVPVAPASTCRELESEADAVVSVSTPEPFGAVGAFYWDFHQTGDGEVRAALARARHP